MPGGQVITAHHSLVTAAYAGLVRMLAALIRASLKDKYVTTDGLSTDEQSAHVHSNICGEGLMTFLEADMSKYDKSQEEIALMVNIYVMRAFGFPILALAAWASCHTTSRLIFHTIGVYVKTSYQRKSGDVMTFTGNTIHTMAAIAWVYRDMSEEFIMGIFCGDDSLIAILGNVRVPDRSAEFAEIFNLTVKIEDYPQCPMFASQFLLYIDGYYRLIPDPLKLLIKLGRDDLYCGEHVDAYFISFCDKARVFRNNTVRMEAAKASLERHAKSMHFAPDSLHAVPEYLCQLTNNKNEFRKLWKGSRKTWGRKLGKVMLEKFRREEEFKQSSAWEVF